MPLQEVPIEYRSHDLTTCAISYFFCHSLNPGGHESGLGEIFRAANSLPTCKHLTQGNNHNLHRLRRPILHIAAQALLVPSWLDTQVVLSVHHAA